MKSLVAFAVSALALTAMTAPAHAATTILFSVVDLPQTPPTAESFTFIAAAPTTTLSFGGYNRNGFDMVKELEVLAGGAGPNLLTDDFALTKAASGSSAFRVGDPWPIDGLAFGGATPGAYDVYAQSISTIVGQSYTLNFDLQVSAGPNGFFVSETDVPAAAAVPEPASWALMLAGFGLAGAALRSRRRPAAPLSEIGA